VLGNWLSRRMWEVSVGKPVTASLERQMRWEPINNIG
jgi:hypothetical protein